MQEKFWMVVGGGPPTYRHKYEMAARMEAERLARQQRGATFYVVEAVAAVTASDVHWDERLTESIPF